VVVTGWVTMLSNPPRLGAMANIASRFTTAAAAAAPSRTTLIMPPRPVIYAARCGAWSPLARPG
jgi:hypothetical protein